MKRPGFTLIEMLISIVIFSFVIALAAYSFRFYANIVKKIVMPYPQQAVNFSKLNNSLRSIFYFTAEEENLLGEAEFFTYFYGNSREMKFISAEPVDIKDNLAVCRLYVDNDTLILKESPVYSPYNNYKNPFLIKKKEKTIKIMKNVTDFSLTYFINNQITENIKQEIPQLIEIKLKSKDKQLVWYFKIKSNFKNKKALTESLYAPF